MWHKEIKGKRVRGYQSNFISAFYICTARTILIFNQAVFPNLLEEEKTVPKLFEALAWFFIITKSWTVQT